MNRRCSELHYQALFIYLLYELSARATRTKRMHGFIKQYPKIASPSCALPRIFRDLVRISLLHHRQN